MDAAPEPRPGNAPTTREAANGFAADPREAAIDLAIARDQIRDCVARYSHGIDRCDAAALRTVFWPDGHCDYGSFRGSAMDFVDGVIAGLMALDRTQHLVGNVMIALESPTRARGESYVWAWHDMGEGAGDGEDTDNPRIRLVGGRYLDTFERRGDEWRILARHYLMDWNQNAPSTQDWRGWIYGALNRGARHPSDPAIGWLAGASSR